MIPQRFQAHCAFCGQVIDIRKPGVYQLTTGWVKNRKEGGGNAVALAEKLHYWSCPPCMDSKLHSNGNVQYELNLFASGSGPT